MTLTLHEVRHIAYLARLELSDQEERRYAEQLSAVLEYASRLGEVDTSHIPPTASVLPLFAPLREDIPRDSLPREDILTNAPATEAGMFQVPPILEEGPQEPSTQSDA